MYLLVASECIFMKHSTVFVCESADRPGGGTCQCQPRPRTIQVDVGFLGHAHAALGMGYGMCQSPALHPNTLHPPEINYDRWGSKESPAYWRKRLDISLTSTNQPRRFPRAKEKALPIATRDWITPTRIRLSCVPVIGQRIRGSVDRARWLVETDRFVYSRVWASVSF